MSWETKNLKLVCEVFTDGNWIEKKDQSIEGIRLIQTGNIGEGFFKNKEEKSRFISEKTFERLKCFEVLKGDCLISRLPDPVGKACIIPEISKKMITAVDCTIARFNPKIIYPYFFNYYSQSLKYLSEVNSKITGATRKRISRKNLGEIDIPVPMLNEQKQIVKILDKNFENISMVKKNLVNNLKNAKEIFESYLESVFSNPGEDWEKSELNKYVKFIDYRGKTPKKTLSGIRLITAKNIKKGFVQRHPEEFINPNEYDTWMTRGIPKKGDILFTTEAPLANVAQLDTDEKVAFAQRTIIFQPIPEKLNQTFLKYLILSNPIQKKILEKGTGATVKGIKSSLLKKIEIYFPKSLTEQKTIVSKLNALSKEIKRLESIYEQKIKSFEELKKSILKKAFNGELTGNKK